MDIARDVVEQNKVLRKMSFIVADVRDQNFTGY